MASIGMTGNVSRHPLDPAGGQHTGALPITLKVAAVDAEPINARGAYSHCDGIDDQVQINAAIAVLVALGHGGRVELTDGHFYVTASIIISSNIEIVGTGTGTVIVVPVGCNYNIFDSSNLVDNDNITIRDLYIDGLTNGGPGAMTFNNNGVFIYRAQHLLIEHVYFAGLGSSGIDCETAPTVVYTNWISKCYIGNSGAAAIFLVGGRFIVANCEVDTADMAGIYLENTPRSIILGCHVFDTDPGIWLRDTDSCIVKSNVVSDNTGTGISVTGLIDCIIKGNISVGNSTDGINIGDGGNHRIIVEGNIARNNVGFQIINANLDNIVRHNIGHVTENKGTGIIAAAATAVVVAHGLSITPTAQDIIITPTNNPTNDPGNIWVNTIGAVNFTVNCRNVPGVSTLTFSWQVQVL